MNRVEEWRRRHSLTQRDVARKIGATDAIVVKAEKGRPIRREFILAYIKLAKGDGSLLASDFTEAAIPNGGELGRTEKGRREIAGSVKARR